MKSQLFLSYLFVKVFKIGKVHEIYFCNCLTYMGLELSLLYSLLPLYYTIFNYILRFIKFTYILFLFNFIYLFLLINTYLNYILKIIKTFFVYNFCLVIKNII